MNVVSLFSGVGGLDMGLERAGMNVIAHCEYDKHASNVLAHHWPDVPNHGDVTSMEGHEYAGRTDLVCGGSPCQDLSVAGRREGLGGGRSGLFWEQCRIATETAASWVLWENVAGALSSNRGQDFAAVLWGLTGNMPQVPEDGWRSAGMCVGPNRTAVWRMLDAQWFGVAQRRRRVFVVAGARDICGPEILALGQSVSGCPRPSRTPGTRAAALTSTGVGTCGPDDNQAQAGHLIVFGWKENQMAGNYRDDGATETLTTTKTQAVMVEPDAFSMWQGPNGDIDMRDVHPTLQAYSGAGRNPSTFIPDHEPAVRRLTPVECERLMGWPDDHTAGQADSHRYKQCGNGVVSNCTEWIGRNIMAAVAA